MNSLESTYLGARSWVQHIEDSYGDTPRNNLLPDDAGDINIEDF